MKFYEIQASHIFSARHEGATTRCRPKIQTLLVLRHSEPIDFHIHEVNQYRQMTKIRSDALMRLAFRVVEVKSPLRHQLEPTSDSVDVNSNVFCYNDERQRHSLNIRLTLIAAFHAAIVSINYMNCTRPINIKDTS